MGSTPWCRAGAFHCPLSKPLGRALESQGTGDLVGNIAIFWLRFQSLHCLLARFKVLGSLGSVHFVWGCNNKVFARVVKEPSNTLDKSTCI